MSRPTPTSDWKNIIAKRDEAIAGLTAALDEQRTDSAAARAETHSANMSLSKVRERNEELTNQFGDLKERLHKAEIDNERLRGYIERVLEDDVVNEDLIKVGEPDGAERFVPKRISKILQRVPRMSQVDLDSIEHHIRTSGHIGYADEAPKRPQHWIRYGDSE
jgi:chromosome segregation ATPase